MTKNPNYARTCSCPPPGGGRSPVTVFLVNGFQMRGTITGFDPFTVTVSAEGKQSLIYKHAISTISPARPVDLTAWENGE